MFSRRFVISRRGVRAAAGFRPPFLVSSASLIFLGALAACTPHIGDHCNLNTDCSLQGTLVCDNAQPNGYCTSFNCAPNRCQDNAVCVMLDPAVPGCPYNGYQAPSRTQRTLCLAHCNQDADCRAGEGYECRRPSDDPWNALIMDDNQNQKVCLARPTRDGGRADAGTDAAAVCLPIGPTVPPIGAEDAGTSDGPAGG